MNDTVRVKIENSYECGRHSIEYVEVPPPEADELDDWWDEQVHDLTGDGHKAGEGGEGCRGGDREHAYYGAEIVAAQRLELVGQQWSWEG